MYNARKKYQEVIQGNILALLESIESSERGIENIMNDSDTEFGAEDETVISTNIARKEEIGDQLISFRIMNPRFVYPKRG